jgi:hypothetical protein
LSDTEGNTNHHGLPMQVPTLRFGHAGGCEEWMVSRWGSIAYDTFAYGQGDGDDDGDTVSNALDGCPWISDVDQADRDADLYGDACDICVDDPDNDADDDGACSGEDPCPGDPLDRDVNADRICDLDQDACDVDPPSCADGDGMPWSDDPPPTAHDERRGHTGCASATAAARSPAWPGLLLFVAALAGSRRAITRA